MEKINDYTIYETYELPSKGLIYDKPINPEIKLRSMQTQEEMKRLSPSDSPYKVMSDVIEACCIDKPDISIYDLCLGDYEFLLHKLRIVTYGPEYKMNVRCPSCNGIFETVCDLDSLQVKEYTESIEELRNIVLPVTGKSIELKIQTPRVLDNIAKRKKDIIRRNPEMLVDPGYLLTLEAAVKTVDGQVLSIDQLEAFVRKLPMKDANYLLGKSIKFKESVGLETDFSCTCKHCGFETISTFRITSEFFGPTVD